MWNFERLPPEEYDNVLKHFEAQNFVALLVIYNKYKISSGRLTACCAFATIKIWSEYGIREYINPAARENNSGILQPDSENPG